MRSISKLTVSALAVALTLGTGNALAHSPKGRAVKSAATYIGVTVDQLRQELKSGKSLAGVAVAHGKTQAGLEAAIVADAKTHLDATVASGKLTADREAQILAKLQANVSKVVTATGPPAGTKQKGKHAIRAAVKTAATYVGVTVEQIRTQLQAGKSLAEIATAQGKSVDGLKAVIVTDAKAAIATLVSSGKITAERGQQYLDQIQKNIDKIVNAKRQTG